MLHEIPIRKLCISLYLTNETTNFGLRRFHKLWTPKNSPANHLYHSKDDKSTSKLVIEIRSRLKDSELRKKQEQCLNGCDF
jgi:hypothetical protein